MNLPLRRVDPVPVIAVISAVVLAGLFVLLAGSGEPTRTEAGATHDGSAVMVYCAASNRAVMESIREAYETEHGIRIDVQYGPSQTLLSSIEVSRTGDLYLPADDSYLALAKEKGLIAETLTIAQMRAVVVVARGNPKAIETCDDLIRDDVRLVLASPETAAIGKVGRDALQQAGRWRAVQRACTAFRATVNEVAADVAIGAADAGIVYDAVLHTYQNVDRIELPELSPAASHVAVGVIRSTKQRDAALQFARYLAAEDGGLQHYRRFGFHVSTTDRMSVLQDVP